MRSLLGLLLATLLIAGLGHASAACTVDLNFNDNVGSGCARCSADGSRCEECGVRYGLKQDGTCTPCQPVKVGKLLEEDAPVRCLKCDGDTPSVCQDCIYLPLGYGITTSASKSGSFPALFPNAKGECEYCPDPGCNKCLPGNGTCVECKFHFGAAPAEAGGVTCVECSADLDYSCNSCDANDTKKCLSCRSTGTYLADNQTCKTCWAAGIENCDECPDGKACKTCSFAFVLDASGNCTECPENCDKCSEVGKCDACSYGFGPDGQGGCAPCKIEGCTKCTTSVDTCEPQGCDMGFFDAEKKTCVACAEGCVACDGSPDNCFAICMDGFGLVAKPDNKGACEKCQQANCNECNDDVSKCNQCREGYTVDKATGACVKCPEGCAQCDSAAGPCTFCDVGRGLVDGQCLQCQTVANCGNCDDDVTVCSYCANPYYLSETTKKCEQCPPQCGSCSDDTTCASCSDDTTCASCADGYDWNEDATDCVKDSS